MPARPQAAGSPSGRADHRFRRQWLVTLGALLLFGTTVAYLLRLERRTIESLERDRLVVQARAIDKNLTQQLLATHNALERVVTSLHGGMPDGSSNAMLAAIEEAIPGLRTLLIIDARGIVQASNRSELIGRDSRGWVEYFPAGLVSLPPDTLSLSKPLTTPLQVYAMNLSRVVPGSGGRLDGVIVATLDPQYFRTLLESVQYAPDTWASITHGDGIQFLMVPDRQGESGKDLARPGSFFVRHRESGRTESILAGADDAMGAADRMVAFRTVTAAQARVDPPLVVAVGRDRRAVFAGWRHSAIVYGGGFIAVVCVALFSLEHGQRHVRQADEVARASREASQRSEARHREAAQYARSLIEVSLDPLVTINAEGRITDVNAATIGATGVPRESLIGTDFSSYFTEPLRAQEGYRRVFAQGSVTDYPLTIRHRDGRLTDVLYNASVYRDVQGEVLGVFGAARDVTKQRQAARYARSLIEASLDPLVTISPEGKITDVNQATVDATGLPREALIGTDFSHYFTEPEKAQEGYRRVFAQGSVIDYPLTLRHRDGRLTDVLYNASVYRDVQGSVLGVFAAARDVTESRRLLRAYAETRDFLDNVLQSSTRYSIIGEGLEHEILSWNEGARRNYGYSADEVVGKDSGILHTPEDLASGAVARLLETAYEKGLAEGEFVCVRKDGSRFLASVVVTRRHDASGRPIGFLLMSTDISERKRAEESVRQALREKETLLREIHHRVKNNMQVVSSLLDLQSQKITDGGLRGVFQESQRRVRSMALVHEKLYQTKTLSAIDFRDYVTTIVQELSSYYNSAERRIATTVDVVPIALNLDLAIPCALVINELLTNAYKHAFAGRVAGEVRIRFSESDGTCRLSVTDDGVGMPGGFDWHRAPTLGFQLVTVLVRQLKGSVELTTNGGVRIDITFRRSGGNDDTA